MSKILMYHSVAREEERNKSFFTTSVENFEWQMEYLKKNKFKVDILENVLENKENKENRKSVALTFDDGYLDNLENVLPIVKKYNFPISIFIPTDLIGKKYENSIGESLQIMNLENLKKIQESSLVTIYPHSHLHKVSTEMSLQEFEEDVKKSIEIIKNLGGKTDIFCYPKGKIGEGTKKVLKILNFKFAFSVKNGDLENSLDNYELNRLPIDSAVQKWKFKVYMSKYLGCYLQIKKIIRNLI